MMNITIDINGIVLDHLHVRRLKPLRNLQMPKDNDVECTYEVTVGAARASQLHTKHRYGNGARALTRHILNELNKGEEE